MAILKDKYFEFVHRSLEEVLTILRLPESSYERIVKISILTADTRLSELAGALEAGDRPKVGALLHDLKGMFGNLRIEPLVQLLVTIEREFQSSGVSGPVAKHVEDLSEKFKALKDIFKKEGE